MIAITGQPCLKGANDVCFRHEKPCLVMIEKGFSNYQPDVEIGILSQKNTSAQAIWVEMLFMLKIRMILACSHCFCSEAADAGG